MAGKDYDELSSAAEEVKEFLRRYPSVFSIFDSHSAGKLEVQLASPRHRSWALLQSDLARQVRYAFHGAEAQRIQRDREIFESWFAIQNLNEPPWET